MPDFHLFSTYVLTLQLAMYECPITTQYASSTSSLIFFILSSIGISTHHSSTRFYERRHTFLPPIMIRRHHSSPPSAPLFESDHHSPRETAKSQPSLACWRSRTSIAFVVFSHLHACMHSDGVSLYISLPSLTHTLEAFL